MQDDPITAAVKQAADRIVRDVAELPDRTSPDDWPDAMLVTADELHAIVLAAMPAVRAMVRSEVVRECADVCLPRIKSTAGLTGTQIINRSHEFARGMEAEEIRGTILALAEKEDTGR